MVPLPAPVHRTHVARNLHDPLAMALHCLTRRVFAKAGIGQRRADRGVAQGFLDLVQINAITCEPGADCSS